jgi:hypothetical protein
VKRRFVALPFIFVAGLVVSLHASAATKDVNVTADVHITGGQYELAVANLGDMEITSFTFMPSPTLQVGAITSTSKGTCAKSGAGFSCTVTLAPPPCPCGAGEDVHVFFGGSGDATGSKVQVGAMVFNATGGGAITPTPTTTTTTTTTTATPPPAKPPAVKPKAKKKVVPKCKKGQKSTKKKPCRK